MYDSIAEWRESMPSILGEEVKNIIKVCTDYITENCLFFRHCGFYVVGSSLQNQDFNDIDLVVVGLDFREVFNYTPAFLDPNKLSEETKAMAREDGELIGHYSIFQIKSTPPLAELVTRITTALPHYAVDDWDFNPFTMMPYVHDSLGEWLVSRAELYQGKDKYAAKSPLIDLMFHAENLLVSSWKEWQEREGLPYLPIVELYDPRHDILENRSQFEQQLPDFIDPKGKTHMKMKYWKEGHGKLKKPLF